MGNTTTTEQDSARPPDPRARRAGRIAAALDAAVARNEALPAPNPQEPGAIERRKAQAALVFWAKAASAHLHGLDERPRGGQVFMPLDEEARGRLVRGPR